MSRGYRVIVFALVGWLSLTAATSPEQQPTQSEQSQDKDAITQSLKEIAAALEAANRPPKDDTGCKAGQDERKSDLCAQWKAADAAKESAEWTRRTFWLALFGTVIGAFTLAAAGFAAWYARKAARHTETGATEANRAANAAEQALSEATKASAIQLRPYLQFADTDNFDEPQLFQRGERAKFAIQNFGQTPAQNVSIQIGWDILRRPIGDRSIADLSNPEFYGSIAPGQRVTDALFIDFPPAEIARIAAGEVLILRMRISYDWEIGSDSQDMMFSLASTCFKPWKFGQLSRTERKRAE